MLSLGTENEPLGQRAMANVSAYVCVYVGEACASKHLKYVLCTTIGKRCY